MPEKTKVSAKGARELRNLGVQLEEPPPVRVNADDPNAAAAVSAGLAVWEEERSTGVQRRSGYKPKDSPEHQKNVHKQTLKAEQEKMMTQMTQMVSESKSSMNACKAGLADLAKVRESLQKQSEILFCDQTNATLSQRFQEAVKAMLY